MSRWLAIVGLVLLGIAIGGFAVYAYFVTWFWNTFSQ